MSTNLIADLVVIGVLILGVVLGAKKGFIKTIAGLVIVVVSIFGAKFLSSIVTEPITCFVFPLVEESVTSKIGNNVIDPSGIDIVDRAVESAAGTVTPILKVTAEAFVRSIVHAVAFLFCFLVLTIVLRLLMDAVDKVFDLPLLKSVNGILGAVCGLIQALLILFLVPYVAKHLGIRAIEELSQDTVLLSYFVNNSIFDLMHLFL